MSKRIVICFDGTRNDPKDADQEIEELGGIEDDGISNILKLYFLLGGRLDNLNQMTSTPEDPLEPSFFENQMVFYFQGVGTYGGPLRRLLNFALAPVKLDVGRIIKMGQEVLREHYEPGDEIVLFGFSRGAAIARRFASVIGDEENRPVIEDGAIRFLGVFDTVASFNKPVLDSDEKLESDVFFEHKNVVASTVKEALHLLALDERRIAFRPTLMADEERVTEVWFPGVHSDIGGGYYYDGLSDITLDYLLKEIDRRDIPLETRDEEDVTSKEIVGNKFGLDARDIGISPNHLSKLHWHIRKKDALCEDRNLRVCVSGENSNVNQVPLVHHSAIDLTQDIHSYYSTGLKNGTPYQVIDDNGERGVESEFHAGQIRNSASNGAKKLAVGEAERVKIFSSHHYCPTNLAVKAGEKYRFTPVEGTYWMDASIKCDAFGWKAEDKFWFLKRAYFSYKEGDRRYPEAEWFELIGSIGRSDETLFRATHYVVEDLVIPKDGELFMFPNDLGDYYDNNRGHVEVIVKRVS